MITLHDAPTAPRGLLFLATFNGKERALISENPKLRNMIRESAPHEWPEILQSWWNDQAAKIAERIGPCTDETGYRAQAQNDLRGAAAEFAALKEGRRTGLFTVACRLAKYVHHGFLSELEFRGAFMEAARANSALAKHGPAWAETTLRSALNCARNDALPPLARGFRTNGGRT